MITTLTESASDSSFFRWNMNFIGHFAGTIFEVVLRLLAVTGQHILRGVFDVVAAPFVGKLVLAPFPNFKKNNRPKGYKARVKD